MNDALLRLAKDAGIEGGYWDGLGVWRDLKAPTATALLAALDIEPSIPAEVQSGALADAGFRRPLPPTVVVRLQQVVALVVALPLGLRDDTLAWQLVLENGETLRGEFVAASLTQLEEREVDGQRFGRFRLPLPENIPPGYHRFRLPALACDVLFIAAPSRCYRPEAIEGGRRCWGLAIQLYALRSAYNWGIGDFSDLAALATAAGQAGAAFVGLNPLHARHLCKPDDASPYSPSSRVFLDPVYIDIARVEDLNACPEARAMIADAGFAARLAAARNGKLVDYPVVTNLKRSILQLLFRSFMQRKDDLQNDRSKDFRSFCAHGGESLLRFAEFEALQLHFYQTLGHTPPWSEWPQGFRDAHESAMATFRTEAAEQIEFQIYLQWLAARQLEQAALAARESGMAIGLYCDLAVGAAQDSAETWSEPHLFARGVSIGAPPDMLNRQGQGWGLASWNPRALARDGYASFRRVLAANMHFAGALRIDHVMALTRLFWIPDGMRGEDGSYVRIPLEEMAAIVALESTRNRCMIIGEDLGAVPEGLRDRLHDWGFLSYRVMVYERHWHSDGRFCLPHEYPPQSLAIVATHDMPTMTEYWQGGDIPRRASLGMYPGETQREEDIARRRAERDGLLRMLGEIDRSPDRIDDAAAVIASLHAALAQTGSSLAVVQLDDLLGETEPMNIPGTDREYPNWRRKLSLPLEQIFGDARWSKLASIMREAGRC